MSTALTLENVNVYYGQIHALRDVSIEVEAGKITTLLGANGAGKTTLLRAISRMLPVRSGRIRYGGLDLLRATPDELGAAGLVSGLGKLFSRTRATEPYEVVKLGIAQSPEGRQVFPNLTVLENLDLGAYTRDDAAGVKKDLDRVLSLWPRLAERLQQKAGTLSGGEQQMLAMGRAMMARPKLLLLDEPSLGLAPVIVAGIFETIKAINAEGTTVLLVEQNAHLALKIAHTGYVLETGRIQKKAPAAELLSDDAIREAYLGGH